jgi:hypothetical protein
LLLAAPLAGTRRQRWSLAIIVSAFVFCVTVAMRAQVLASQDLYLHISVGRWILANHSIPDHGIFSASMPDAPWVAHEWLASVGLAFLYDHLGWGGVVAAIALLLAIAIGVLTWNIAGTLGPVGALFAALLAWGLCINHLVARPHVAAMPLFVIWIAAHVRARNVNRIPSFYVVPLMALWANLHGSFMLGLGFTLLFAAEAIFESDTIDDARAAAMRWGGFLAASILAAVATPHGLTGLLFPIQLVNAHGALDSVLEWQPSTTVNSAPLFLWCALLLFLALSHGVKMPLCRLIMLMLLLYMAFAHRRHVELLGLAAPLLLQFTIADTLSRSSPSIMSRWGPFARPAAGLLTAVAVLVAGLFGIAGCAYVVRGPDEFTPATALAAVQARGIDGPVLNSQNFGGYFIFRNYPPFIDGRVDMYGDAFMLRYAALSELASLLEQYRIAWTIFEPDDARIVLLDKLPGWTRQYADDTAVVHVRTPSSH